MAISNKGEKELYIVDVNVTSRQRRYLSDKGVIKALEKGVYIRSDLDESTMLKKYAMRIYSHVYKNSYFSDISAKLGKPFKNTIFMKGTHITKKENFGVSVAHFKNKFDFPKVKEVLLSDDIGDFTIRISGDVQLILESLNSYKNYPHSRLNDDDFKKLFDDICESSGSRESAMREIYNFADKNNLHEGYGQLVSRIDILSSHGNERKRDLLHEFDLHWYDKKFGSLSHDGTGWNFDYASGWVLPLSETIGRYKELPDFVEALMPEVAIGNKLDMRNIVGSLKSGKRYLSNVSIVDKDYDQDHPDNKFHYVEDMLEGTIEEFSDEHSVFLGKHKNIPERDNRFEINFGRLMNNIDIPKLSGMQLKMPAYLSYDGKLQPVLKDEPFTHILKLPGSSDYMHLGLLEWLTLKGLEYADIEIAKISLVNVAELNHKPAVISERFDIRKGVDEDREIFCEDLSSIMSVTSDNKYTKSAEEIGVAILKASTNPEEDANIYMKQIISSWLMGNGDFHLKNLVMIKDRKINADHWGSIRLAPAFDVINTSVLHQMDHKSNFGIEGETFGIKVNGKNFDLNADDFIELGQMLNLKKQDVSSIIEDITSKLNDYTYHIDDMLPTFVKEQESMLRNIEELKTSVRYRIENFKLESDINLNNKVNSTSFNNRAAA